MHSVYCGKEAILLYDMTLHVLNCSDVVIFSKQIMNASHVVDKVGRLG